MAKNSFPVMTFKVSTKGDSVAPLLDEIRTKIWPHAQEHLKGKSRCINLFGVVKDEDGIPDGEIEFTCYCPTGMTGDEERAFVHSKMPKKLKAGYKPIFIQMKENSPGPIAAYSFQTWAQDCFGRLYGEQQFAWFVHADPLMKGDGGYVPKNPIQMLMESGPFGVPFGPEDDDD